MPLLLSLLSILKEDLVMKNRKKIFLLSFTLFLLSFCTIALGAEKDAAQVNALKFGLLTLLPPVIAIVLAFVTKNVVISLFLGILAGCVILQFNGTSNIIYALVHGFLDMTERMLNSIADPWNAGIVLQVLAIGGLISLVSKMGGAKAVAEALSKKAKTPKSAQLISWLLGILVFFDDYANSLIVGPIMRPIADKLKVSREKLAFVVDATAAPIAGLAIISTWIGLEVGLIKDAFSQQLGQNVNGFGIFLNTIPFRFYNILILAFVVITALAGREFGPMLKAERAARARSEKASNENVVIDTDLEPESGVKLSVWNAIIPIGTLIAAALGGFYYSGYKTILGGEDKALISLVNNSPASFASIRECFGQADASIVLFQAAIIATIVAIIMAFCKKIFSVSKAVEIWVDGMKPLVITGVILILAWSLSSVIKELGTAKFLVSILSNSVPKFLLPSIIFIFGSVISFATGTSYGTMGILMPLTVPLASAISPDMGYITICVSGVLTGAIFGDHCSPISDTTILSSMGAGCHHIDHVKTQIWYALFVAAVTILFGYIPAGLGLPVVIVLPVALLALTGLTYLIGKPVEVTEKSNS